MLRKTLLLLIVLVAFPTIASAHTNVSSSAPAANQTETNPIKEITLTFNTDIEPLSSVEILNEQGGKLTPTTVQVASPLIKAQFEAALPNGKYSVNWKIVGKDGHPVSGSYTFSVQLPQPTATLAPSSSPSSSPTATASATPTVSPAVSPAPSSASTPTPEAADADSGPSTNWTVMLIGVVVVLLMALVQRLRRKKR
ncbi:copper resistance CopC family protein [Paenibacillus koleovorans]|uniref:copper resistance CopC family protein n=1 Tax=Paenibacillus koleovorans TaxID=121608 RepID=UPI000FD6BD8D|nr:copper resistance protein CopC [Paenibacillus koleovorans]